MEDDEGNALPVIFRIISMLPHLGDSLHSCFLLHLLLLSLSAAISSCCWRLLLWELQVFGPHKIDVGYKLVVWTEAGMRGPISMLSSSSSIQLIIGRRRRYHVARSNWRLNCSLSMSWRWRSIKCEGPSVRRSLLRIIALMQCEFFSGQGWIWKSFLLLGDADLLKWNIYGQGACRKINECLDTSKVP